MQGPDARGRWASEEKQEVEGGPARCTAGRGNQWAQARSQAAAARRSEPGLPPQRGAALDVG